MYISICLDRGTGESRAQYKARALELESLAPDLVLLAREDADGVLSPPTVEGLVDLAWITGLLQTPAVVSGLPALHSLPFHVARALSGADYLSDGRAGWMPLIGRRATFDAAYGAANDGVAATVRADDFVRATCALWDSWDDDALILDKDEGRYLDSAKVRRISYAGPHFATMGSLNAARPPQGYPLLVRDVDDYADSSETADILIGTTRSDAANCIHLLKIAADPWSATARVEAGEADGLHLSGTNALAMLRELRAASPSLKAQGATARARFGLPHPVNPFSAKVTA